MMDEEPETLELAELPAELLSAILTFLPAASLSRAAQSSRALAAALGEPVWKAHVCMLLGVSPEEVEAHVPNIGPVLDLVNAERQAAPWRALLQAYAPMPQELVVAPDLSSEGLRAAFTGLLGGDRALRTELPLPSVGACYAALRTYDAAHGPGHPIRLARAASGLAPQAPPPRAPPPPPRQLVELCDFWYFEVTIDACDRSRLSPAALSTGHLLPWQLPHAPCVSVGLSNKRFPLQGKQAGWDRNSLGWHGDDGCIFHGSGRGIERIGSAGRFGAGDVVGCGVHLQTGLVFFTRNGDFVAACFVLHPWLLPGFSFAPSLMGSAPTPAALRRRALFPAVGVDGHYELSLNMGARPFASAGGRFDGVARRGGDGGHFP